MLTPNEQIGIIRELVEALRGAKLLTQELEAAADSLILDLEPTAQEIRAAVELMATRVDQRVDAHLERGVTLKHCGAVPLGE